MSPPEIDVMDVARRHFNDAGVVKEVRDASGDNQIVVVTTERGYGFGNIIEDFQWDIQIWETWAEDTMQDSPKIAHVIEVQG